MKEGNYKNNPSEDNVKIVSHCPVCGNKFNPLTARVIDENSESHLIYIRCSSCKSNIVALVFYNETGLTSVGMVTDLNYDELVNYQPEKKIEVEDVLDFHQLVSRKDFVREFLK